MRLACLLLALGVLASSACSWAKAPPLAQGTVESRVAQTAALPFTLGPGDRLSVVVFGHPENSTPEEGARIDPEGHLDLPLVGPVRLAGLTTEQARARLGEEFGRFLRAPRVSLNLLEQASRRFYVFGEMEIPGAHVLDRPLTALQALSLAGDFRSGADRKNVALLRGQGEELEVYFFDGATPGPDGMVAVRPDDFLFVRLSGAGTFRDQILPIVQSIVPPLTGLASLVLVADSLNQ